MPRWYCYPLQFFQTNNLSITKDQENVQLNIKNVHTSLMRASWNSQLIMIVFIIIMRSSFKRHSGFENRNILVLILLASMVSLLETLSLFLFVRIESRWNYFTSSCTALFLWVLIRRQRKSVLYHNKHTASERQHSVAQQI